MTFSFLPKLSNCRCSNLKRCTFLLIKWKFLSSWCLRGNRFYISDVELHWATSIWHRFNGQHDVFWRDPFRSLAIRASQLEITLMFRSNQPSSVIFSGLHSGLYPASALWVSTKQHERLNKPLLRDTTAALLVCVHDQCEILTLRGHCNERQPNISLIISGTISCQWAVDGVALILPVSRVR